jgi:hypothetical protein
MSARGRPAEPDAPANGTNAPAFAAASWLAGESGRAIVAFGFEDCDDGLS